MAEGCTRPGLGQRYVCCEKLSKEASARLLSTTSSSPSTMVDEPFDALVRWLQEEHGMTGLRVRSQVFLGEQRGRLPALPCLSLLSLR